MDYKIISVPEDAREDTEQLGSKPKFWVSLGEGRWLFKEARPDTGEDWAEKVAAELAHALGIPAAGVELADYCGQRGCVSRNFVDTSSGQALIHGNEILAGHLVDYDRNKTFRQSDHTLDNVVAAVRALLRSESAATAALTQLASYLVLDALIGNTDRHHENWGLLVQPVPAQLRWLVAVAPSYDHASSLGRELQDARRGDILKTAAVSRYVRKGRGGIFRDPSQARGENPLMLLTHACEAYPSYFRPAIGRISTMPDGAMRRIVERLPEDRASRTAKEFASQMLAEARAALVQITQ